MYHYKNILIVSDNRFLIEAFHKLTSSLSGIKVTYTCSPKNAALLADKSLPVSINALSIKEDWDKLNYDLIFSLHCKQLFPEGLVKKVKCINVHPGLNPYNRGWFPQVFSILNGMKAGATIHEIDEHLDHGNIIAQREVKIEQYDTSLSAYHKIQDAEVELLKEHLESILSNTYIASQPAEEGNVNLKKDFNTLCQLDLTKTQTIGATIDLLRALSHGEYKNAWFWDEKREKKIFVKLDMEAVKQHL